MVDDLDDSSEAAALKLENTANLYAAPRCRSDVEFRHFGRLSGDAVVLVRSVQQGAWRSAKSENEEEKAGGSWAITVGREMGSRVPLMLCPGPSKIRSRYHAPISRPNFVCVGNWQGSWKFCGMSWCRFRPLMCWRLSHRAGQFGARWPWQLWLSGTRPHSVLDDTSCQSGPTNSFSGPQLGSILQSFGLIISTQSVSPQIMAITSDSTA